MPLKIFKCSLLFVLDCLIALAIIGGVLVAFHNIPAFWHDVTYSVIVAVSILLLKTIGMHLRMEIITLISVMATKRRIKREYKKHPKI